MLFFINLFFDPMQFYNFILVFLTALKKIKWQNMNLPIQESYNEMHRYWANSILALKYVASIMVKFSLKWDSFDISWAMVARDLKCTRIPKVWAHVEEDILLVHSVRDFPSSSQTQLSQRSGPPPPCTPGPSEQCFIWLKHASSVIRLYLVTPHT